MNSTAHPVAVAQGPWQQQPGQSSKADRAASPLLLVPTKLYHLCPGFSRPGYHATPACTGLPLGLILTKTSSRSNLKVA
jgi:hypothetical protein